MINENKQMKTSNKPRHIQANCFKSYNNNNEVVIQITTRKNSRHIHRLGKRIASDFLTLTSEAGRQCTMPPSSEDECCPTQNSVVAPTSNKSKLETFSHMES